MWKSGLGIMMRTHFFSAPGRPATMLPLQDLPAPYPESVRPETHHPSVPPEALARRLRLHATLEAMAARGPSLEAACLQALRFALDGIGDLEPAAWLQQVQVQGMVEEGAAILRARHPGGHGEQPAGPLEQHLGDALAPLAARAHAKRQALHHLDSRRVVFRCGFSKADPALDFDDRDLQMLFLQAFRLEGVEVALDLGKRPHPLLSSDHPLPAGAGGLDESMDVTLRAMPRASMDDLSLRLQKRLPEGLRLHGLTTVPNYASPLGDRGIRSHWQWRVPSGLQQLVTERCHAFLDGSERPSAFILEMSWDAPILAFSSPLGASRAVNPMKVLAAWLGLSPAELRGVMRTGVELKPDVRLAHGDRYEPRLRNLYEDAVLLGEGSNIVLVEEDDDDPLRLG